jgi:hypothetical protein
MIELDVNENDARCVPGSGTMVTSAIPSPALELKATIEVGAPVCKVRSTLSP